MRQCVVERLIPSVEPYLAVGRDSNDRKNSARQHQQGIAHRRCPKGAGHHSELRNETRIGNLCRLIRGAGVNRGIDHGTIIATCMSRVEELIARMTLAEKLGQLTMVASSYAVTGPVLVGDSTAGIKSGAIGNLLNMVGYQHVHEMQA